MLRMKIKSSLIGIAGVLTLLAGAFVLISPYTYQVGGGCKDGLCALPLPEINLPLFAVGLLLSIMGISSLAIFLYRRWWRDNPAISELEIENM